MNEKKITIVLTGDGMHKEIILGITPETTTRVLRRRLREELHLDHIPDMEVSAETQGPYVPQGKDLFNLVNEGGKIYAVMTLGRGVLRVDLPVKNFVGAAADIATDVAENHDLYLSGVLK